MTEGFKTTEVDMETSIDIVITTVNAVVGLGRVVTEDNEVAVVAENVIAEIETGIESTTMIDGGGTEINMIEDMVGMINGDEDVCRILPTFDEVAVYQ